jgi:hypothetical protein
MGTGFAVQAAHELAALLKPAEVIGYADAVHTSLVLWLDSAEDSELLAVPDIRANSRAHAAYQEPAFVQETSWSLGKQAWVLVTRACVTHVSRHLGEVELARTILAGS